LVVDRRWIRKVVEGSREVKGQKEEQEDNGGGACVGGRGVEWCWCAASAWNAGAAIA
jgi:hypothetical protein